MVQRTSVGNSALQPLLLILALIGHVAMATATAAQERTTAHARSLSVMSRMLRSLQGRSGNSAPGDDTKKLVEALEEVVSQFEEEDKTSKALELSTGTECKSDISYLQKALSDGDRAVTLSSDSLQVAESEKQSMDAKLQEIKGQMNASMAEIAKLEQELKTLREDKGLLSGDKSATLKMLQEALSLSYLQGKQHLGRKRLQAKLRAKVSYLEKLGRSLLPAADSQSTPADAASSFVQIHAHESHSQRRASENPTALALMADKQEVMSESSSARKNFDEKEKELLELIRQERKKISTLESQEEEQRVTLVEKMTTIQEIGIKLDGAQQSIQRDTLLLEGTQELCNYTASALDIQDGHRRKVTTNVKMAKSMIMHTDVSVFLTKDIQGFQKSPAAFLQLRSRSHAASASKAVDEDGDTGDVSTDAASLPLGSLVASAGEDTFIQDRAGNNGASSNSNAPAMLLQDDPSPFESVTQMIENLIESLKDQANQDVNKNQLCLDQLAENRKATKSFQQQIAQAKTEVHLAKGNIQQQDEIITGLGETIKTIGEKAAKIQGSSQAEITRVETMQTNHQSAEKVMTDAIVILKQLCNLPDSGSSALLQEGDKFDQCAEAAKLLDTSVSSLKDWDAAIATYLKDYKDLTDRLSTDATSAVTKAENLQQTATTAVAQLKADRVSRQGDLKEAQAQLESLLQTKETIEHGCSHAETHEEKQARRQEEIDALKEAFKVLEGEAVPAYSL